MVARILVAEDNAHSLVLMLHALKGYGYSTAFATDGAEALRLAREEQPDLIVCHLRLSNFNGSQLASQILEEASLRDVPLLAVFDASLPEVDAPKTPAGFVDYVTEPIDPASFIKTVERYIPPILRAKRTPVRPRGRRRKNDPM